MFIRKSVAALSLSLALAVQAGAQTAAFHPILEVYRTNPVFRAAVVEQIATWNAPAIASLSVHPAAPLARQYVLALKAYRPELGRGAFANVLGPSLARAVSALRVDPKELEEVRRGAGSPDQWAARFNQVFDQAAPAAGAVAGPVATTGDSAPSPSRLAPASSAPRAPSERPVPPPADVVFLTDFGLKDPAVAVCKLVMAGINAALRVIDLTHLIPPFNVGLASNFLAAALPHAKPGTVFVAVVDPGVGSARKSVAVLTGKGHLLIGPDNGLFAQAVANEGLVKAVEIVNPAYLYKSVVSSTFHGRDVYAPVAAHLASGVPLEELGPEVTRLSALPAASAPRLENGVIHGEVVYVEDPFGSVLTDIPRSLIEEAGWRPGEAISLEVEIDGVKHVLPYQRTFSDVPLNAPLALIHSRQVFSFSINRGDFARTYGVREGASVVVRLARQGTVAADRDR